MVEPAESIPIVARDRQRNDGRADLNGDAVYVNRSKILIPADAFVNPGQEADGAQNSLAVLQSLAGTKWNVGKSSVSSRSRNCDRVGVASIRRLTAAIRFHHAKKEGSVADDR